MAAIKSLLKSGKGLAERFGALDVREPGARSRERDHCMPGLRPCFKLHSAATSASISSQAL